MIIRNKRRKNIEVNNVEIRPNEDISLNYDKKVQLIDIKENGVTIAKVKLPTDTFITIDRKFISVDDARMEYFETGSKNSLIVVVSVIFFAIFLFFLYKRMRR